MPNHHPRMGQLPRAQRLGAALLLAALALAGCQSAPAAAPPATSAPAAVPASTAVREPTAPAAVERQPVPGGPTLLRAGVELRKIADTAGGSVKLARDPASGALFVLNPANGIYRVALDAPASATKVVAATDIFTDAIASGMAFAPDGRLFVVGNHTVGKTRNQAIVRVGAPAGDGRFTWQTCATTAPYPLSATPFDHMFNGIVVSGDGKWVFLNSGSRTDHGEVEDNGGAFPDTREVPITSAILRVPADARDLLLPNDEAALKPYLFADGTRNAFDLEFAPNGELFAVDNGPDADLPDELNVIREGRHYGFPWRFGDQDNPQQFPSYDAGKDPRLQPDFTAVKNHAYHNDPGFPKPPGAFVDPIKNLGPAAAQYRGDDGKQHDAAAEGKPLATFTPHRSPLGLVFAADAKMPADLRGEGDTLSAFVLSWGAAGGTLADKGQDLLHLRLTKQGDSYEAATTQIARGFSNPIDAVMIENRLYVLEFGQNSAIWELKFT